MSDIQRRTRSSTNPPLKLFMSATAESCRRQPRVPRPLSPPGSTFSEAPSARATRSRFPQARLAAVHVYPDEEGESEQTDTFGGKIFPGFGHLQREGRNVQGQPKAEGLWKQVWNRVHLAQTSESAANLRVGNRIAGWPYREWMADLYERPPFNLLKHVFMWMLGALTDAWVIFAAAAIFALIFAALITRVDRPYCSRINTEGRGPTARWETWRRCALSKPEPLHKYLNESVTLITGMPLHYIDALMPLVEPAPAIAPEIFLPDVAAQYHARARKLCANLRSILQRPSGLPSFSSLTRVDQPKVRTEEAKTEAKRLCDSYMAASHQVHRTMRDVWENLRGPGSAPAPWVRWPNTALSHTRLKVWTVTDGLRREEEEERYWTERAGELDEQTWSAKRDIAWHFKKRYNNGILFALLWEADWDIFYDAVTETLTTLRKALGELRGLEEQVLPMVERVLAKSTANDNPNAEPTMPENGAGSWFKLRGKGGKERGSAGSLEDRQLMEAEKTLKALREVDISRRRVLHNAVNLAAWLTAGIQSDFARIAGRWLELHGCEWREPVVSFSPYKGSANLSSSTFASSFRPESIPGVSALLELLFGTIEYTFPPGDEIYDRLSRVGREAGERIELAEKRIASFIQGGGSIWDPRKFQRKPY